MRSTQIRVRQCGAIIVHVDRYGGPHVAPSLLTAARLVACERISLADDQIKSSPAVDEARNTVWVGTHARAVVCLDATDGHLVARWDADGAVFASPRLASDDAVYVATLGGTLAALPRRGSGPLQPRWATHLVSPLFSTPAVVENVVVVGTARGGIVGCDAGHGVKVGSTG